MYLLWDIGKQNIPRCDAAERGVPSGAILFAQRNFIEKSDKKIKITPNTPKNESELIQLIMMGESIRQIRLMTLYVSGDKARTSNPSQYRDPKLYNAMFSMLSIPTENPNEVFGFELVLSKAVNSYIKVKDNAFRIWINYCFLSHYEKVLVGNDQEKVQSERNSHSKNRGGK